FSDVDIFVTYGGQELTDALKADPLLSQLPAVANDAIVYLPGDEPLGTAANPTPLQIPALIDDYVALLAEAVDAAAADAGKRSGDHHQGIRHARDQRPAPAPDGARRGGGRAGGPPGRAGGRIDRVRFPGRATARPRGGTVRIRRRL